MLTIDLNENKQLVITESAKVQTKQGQLLIKVRAAGVNRADLLQRQGNYPPPPGDSPTLGLEVCGEVVAVGEGADGKWQGQQVMALCAGGGYGEYVAVDQGHCLALPPNFSAEQGAGFCEVFLTAFDALRQYPGFGVDHTLLIHGGASGVGTAAIKLAKYFGAKVVATVGSEQKRQACLALGADTVINYRQSDWADTMRAEGLSADVVIDPVAGDYLNSDLKALAQDGKIVILALLGGRYCEQLDVARILQKRASIIGSTLRNRSSEYKSALVKELQHRCEAGMLSGELTPVIDTVYPWEEVEQAHQRLAQNANIGKVILMHK
ncbi:NAD(P)H-quinone oxidoreductase [Pseudoalteromonas sp. T1lg75]|uniref:NAD(P)H-quinone oxidoreductase n=1 Tax=Pseudoalteromonas sp. T1lg75 TaxID=2077102 RepID=UPI000CF74FF1|nr:NAD(P)H-quinone oxidoreductase [Pseudoalteromonas sp. T1lg75]